MSRILMMSAGIKISGLRLKLHNSKKKKTHTADKVGNSVASVNPRKFPTESNGE